MYLPQQTVEHSNTLSTCELTMSSSCQCKMCGQSGSLQNEQLLHHTHSAHCTPICQQPVTIELAVMCCPRIQATGNDDDNAVSEDLMMALRL